MSGGEGVSNPTDIIALQADVDTIVAGIVILLARLTALRAGYLDELGPTNIPADIDTLLARLTALRAGYLDELGPTNLPADIDEIVADTRLIEERQRDMLGIAGLGRANTATLHVSPDGDGSDGLSWRTAYTTPPDAFDACSADANDLTLVLVAPGT